MKIKPISNSVTDIAVTLQSTLAKDTVIVLALDAKGKMNIGWAGQKTVNILGLITWGLTALSGHIINEDSD